MFLSILLLRKPFFFFHLQWETYHSQCTFDPNVARRLSVSGTRPSEPSNIITLGALHSITAPRPPGRYWEQNRGDRSYYCLASKQRLSGSCVALRTGKQRCCPGQFNVRTRPRHRQPTAWRVGVTRLLLRKPFLLLRKPSGGKSSNAGNPRFDFHESRDGQIFFFSLLFF